MEKIVITGIGIISPLGIGKEEFWKNDQAGLSVTCSSEYMKRLLSIVPSEKSIIYVPRTGHNIIYESPEVISSIISDYIN